MTVAGRSIEQLIHASFVYGGQVMTAQDMLSTIHQWFDPRRKTKLSSLSSKLKKMVDGHVLLRVKGFGPRGGYGYVLNPNYQES